MALDELLVLLDLTLDFVVVADRFAGFALLGYGFQLSEVVACAALRPEVVVFLIVLR